MSHLNMRGWASREQLLQIGTDYRAAVDLIDKQGWTKAISDGFKDKDRVCAARAIGIVCGVDTTWDNFAGRASLALSACYRVTGMLLVQVNDKAREWGDLKTIMLGIARDCEDAAYRTGATNV